MATEPEETFLRELARGARAARPLAWGEVVAERFVIGELAGVGGMGAVYRAVDRASGAVAVKVLGRGGERERFAQEAHVLAEFAHPAVVRYVAHGSLGGEQIFLAMEWLDGEDLARRLDRGARMRHLLPATMDDLVASARRLAADPGLGHVVALG